MHYRNCHKWVLRNTSQFIGTFSTHDILKQYAYDKVSNVIKIATDPSQNLSILPTNGELAGPVLHNYEYDNFNRLVAANGWYVGPDDRPQDLLRQEYTLDMAYDESHNILNKAQNHLRGSADPNDPNIFPSNVVPEAMEDTAYNLDYEDYASGSFTAGGHSYVQPHAPRTIVEYPYGAGADEPSAKRKLLDYDANGNLLLVEQEISDPEDPLGKAKISLRENLWDEENRLLAVDLKPEAPSNKPEVAAYTYDASGERTIKYLPGRLDAYYSAKAAGSADRLESILYPSPLLTVKTRPLPEHMEPDELSRTSITKYTKHYYIGTERISSALGTMKNLGLLCENVWPGSQDIIDEMGTKTIDAGDVLIADYDAFEKELQLSEPFIYETYLLCVSGDHEPINYAAYWYHPDHLGSSSYISNTSGEVSQHMEYLPFGETLVEEHLNSYNSPYKFNAKEFDAETGWYYYGARYYNPKWSIWLSVDPLVEKTMESYVYVGNNPIVFIDPDGRFKIPIHKRITTNAFKNSGLSTGWQNFFMNDVKLGVSIEADILGAFSDYHFDGRINYSEIQSTWSKLNADISNIIDDLGSFNRTMGGNDAILLGRMIHTVQDFYAHSNYVELYIEYYKGLNDGAMPTSVPTYDKGIQIEGFDTILKDNLRTGEFNLMDNEFWDLNPTGDNHTGSNSHKAMNKDKADTPAGRLAEKVATEHTTQILKQVKEQE